MKKLPWPTKSSQSGLVVESNTMVLQENVTTTLLEKSSTVSSQNNYQGITFLKGFICLSCVYNIKYMYVCIYIHSLSPQSNFFLGAKKINESVPSLLSKYTSIVATQRYNTLARKREKGYFFRFHGGAEAASNCFLFRSNCVSV